MEDEVKAEVKTTRKSKKKVTSGGSGPKIKWKGAFEFRHDLFKCEVSKMLKRKPSLITRAIPNFDDDLARVEHCHFYHTFNSQGKPMKHTDPVGGHYHEITWELDKASGELRAECGPPITDVTSKSRGGRQVKKKGLPVKYMNQEGDTLVDDHKHDMSYLHSEMLMPSKRGATIGQAQQNLLDILKKEGITLRER